MNIQDKLYQWLRGKGCIDFDLTTIEDAASRLSGRMRLEHVDNTDVTGKLGDRLVQTPVTQASFVMRCSLEPTKFILLKSFDIPATGVTFSQSEEQLWFSIPKPTVPSASLTGYLLDFTYKTTLVKAYTSQFNMGLLSIRRGIDFEILAIKWMEDKAMDIQEIAIALPFVQTLLAAVQGADVLSTLIGAAASVPDIVDDTKVAAKDALYLAECPETLYPFPLLQLKNCKIGPPTITAAADSTELATVRVDLTYNRALWQV